MTEIKNTNKHEFKNAWEALQENEKEKAFLLSNEYKLFLDNSKTERLCAREIIKIAKDNGFVDLNSLIKSGKKINQGDKVYAEIKDKAVVMFKIGDEPIENGMRIVGGHIDAPRIDLKPFPLYEDSGIALFKTHYYGGIKKYQWTSIPLALVGRVVKNDGTFIEVNIGDDDNDPILMISDLLPHLAKDQVTKNLSEGIAGEDLNVIMGSIPVADKDEKEKIKANILNLLSEKYGMIEEDFVSAELEIIPAGKTRDLGLDRSMISGYGHDDRACSYAGMKALLDSGDIKYTAVGMFMDKEEIGSMGNTGSQSVIFENYVAELINLQNGSYNEIVLRRAFMNTKVLSADVTAAYDPTFPTVLDKRNATKLGYGIGIAKYTGVRGKNSCSDANAEFVGEVRKIFNEAGVIWQVGELGKVDQGGGGTIAFILANRGAEVLDCGIPVLSMHAPFEIISKVDLYMTYRGYKAFYDYK